jgi:uncharacterized protein
MNENSDYYVYVYIDPRNFEEFYYGKGTGGRKYAHLADEGDSEKAKRIKDINKSGLKPIIKVIAKDLTQDDAFLIEKTLIWKLGRTLTNVSSGHFAEKFRPHNTMHTNLYGFDYQNGIYYFNVNEHHGGSWVDCKKYGFLSAWGSKIFGEQIQSFHEGDVVMAYLSRKGYVGIGSVTERAVMAKNFRVRGKKLSELDLVSKRVMEQNADDPEKSAYIVKVAWKATCDAHEAKWIKNKKLFTSQMAKASLQNQRETIDFVSSAFKINIENLLKKEEVVKVNQL